MRKIYIALLTVGVLAGAPWAVTHAIFSDSEAIDANTFTVGSVDISTDPTTALVTYSAMLPGDVTTAALDVSNDGTLDLRYAISSSATNADSKGLKDQLVLTIKSVDATAPETPCDDFDGTQLYTGDVDSSDGKLVGDSTQGADSGDRNLVASASETLCFRVSLPSGTGNSYQGATTTVTFTFDAEQTDNN